MARSTQFVVLLVATFVFVVKATPILSSCVQPTITLGNGMLIVGYASATPAPRPTEQASWPAIENYYVDQGRSDQHYIEGFHFLNSVAEKDEAKAKCQERCVENCSSFFVYMNTNVDMWSTDDWTQWKLPHYVCNIYAAPIEPTDLIESPFGWEKTGGEGYNKQCSSHANKKRFTSQSIHFTKAKGTLLPSGVTLTQYITTMPTITLTIKVSSVGARTAVTSAAPSATATAS